MKPNRTFKDTSTKLSYLSKNDRSLKALDLAVKDCILQYIFVDYVNREEFFNMAREEFTMDDFIALKEQEGLL